MGISVLMPFQFVSQDPCIAFILSLLTGMAFAWADRLIRADSPVRPDMDFLMKEIVVAFHQKKSRGRRRP